MINDLGCGYGVLLDYLDVCGFKIDYIGIDVFFEMVCVVVLCFEGWVNVDFICVVCIDWEVDYSVVSGIFNVCLKLLDMEWCVYIEVMFDMLNVVSCCGFFFNCLIFYFDVLKMCDDLYYVDLCVLFDFCKCRYFKSVVFLYDYGLYEFIILVRKVL